MLFTVWGPRMTKVLTRRNSLNRDGRDVRMNRMLSEFGFVGLQDCRMFIVRIILIQTNKSGNPVIQQIQIQTTLSIKIILNPMFE